MKRNLCSFVMLAIAVLICGIGLITGQNVARAESSASAGGVDEMLFALLQTQAYVDGGLSDLDIAVDEVAQNLSGKDLDGDEARKIMAEFGAAHPPIKGTGAFDKTGRIVSTVSNNNVGDDISSEAHIAELLKTKNPVISKEFPSVMGVDTISLVYPIISPSGVFVGGIGALFEPGTMFKSLVEPTLNDTKGNYSYWIMQTDGKILYDRDYSRIGKVLFTDPLYQSYPSLLALGKNMVKERVGHSSYGYQVAEVNKKVVTQEVYWTTVALQGKEFRLAITRIVE